MKQYYKFKGSKAFPDNTLFERNGEEFTPIMGNWKEDEFKERSEGQGFDKVINLNTTFEDVMKVNPTWKQRGVIMPKSSSYEIDGDIDNRKFTKILDLVNKIGGKNKKKIKFYFTDNPNKSITGKKLNQSSDIEPEYKAWVEKKGKEAEYGGGMVEHNDFYELQVNPKYSPEATGYIVGHELGHILYDNFTIPNHLFKDNKRTLYSNGEYVNMRETIADHFSDYLNYNDIYKKFYPNENKFFNNFIRKREIKF